MSLYRVTTCALYQVSELAQVSADTLEYVPNMVGKGCVEGKGLSAGAVSTHNDQHFS